ncbi:MAG: osmoprotectant NAGGN system M42 family peptidase, partial [Hyphomicrobiales bacterium]|nr:osmoprotectant NAGGN system M42 family peptidase [Hyphomicrobiales bacterium]
MALLRIDTNYLQRTLKHLLSVPSPTGYTDVVVRETCKELSSLGIPFALTRRGAIRALVRGKDHRGARGIIAHLDTLGAQVKRIKDNG